MKHNGAAWAGAFTVAGVVVLAAGSFLSAISYSGIQAEPYSFLNHFVSELGWPKVAPSALCFNSGLVVSNVLCLPLMYALGRRVGTRLGYAAMLCGMFMLLAGAAVGLLPMDDLVPHLVAAAGFFWFYLFTVLLFTLAFASPWSKTPSVPMTVVGTVCCIVAVTFLAFPKQSALDAFRDLGSFQRPQIWWLAILEWLVLGSAWLWGSTSALVLCRGELAQGKR